MIDPVTFRLYFFSGVLLVLGLGMLLLGVRLLRGPSLADRVVALDLLGVFAAAGICIYAMQSDRPGLIAVAIIIALVAFLGTVAFAHYLQRGAK